MSDRAMFQVSLHSSRWGTDDPYQFTFDQHQMKIEKSDSMSYAQCNHTPGQDITWSSSEPSFISCHPLIHILENDDIYPPSIFISALEHAWRAWRNNELSDADLETEIGHLFKWVDATTAASPRTDFWRRTF